MDPVWGLKAVMSAPKAAGPPPRNNQKKPLWRHRIGQLTTVKTTSGLQVAAKPPQGRRTTRQLSTLASDNDPEAHLRHFRPAYLTKNVGDSSRAQRFKLNHQLVGFAVHPKAPNRLLLVL